MPLAIVPKNPFEKPQLSGLPDGVYIMNFERLIFLMKLIVKYK